MESKRKVVLLILLVVAIAVVMAAVMSASYMHGRKAEVQSEESRISAVASESIEEIVITSEYEKNTMTNDERLGKVTGEDDDFTLTVDPANFNVTIQGYDKTVSTLASSEKVCHDQMREWMDENEFWDMTEVVYTGKYLRDEAGKQTTLYFQISRYPNSPLCATWHEETGVYSFEIDWQ